MRMKNRCLLSLGIALTLILAGCTTVGPDFEKPEADIPDGWEQPAEAGLETSPHELVEWWKLFNDPVLDDLVEIALQNNNTLEIAGLRVLEAQAQLGIATGLKYPQAQAAAVAGISVSGMKSRVQRGRVKLRELFDACCAIELDARNRVVSYTARCQTGCGAGCDTN